MSTATAHTLPHTSVTAISLPRERRLANLRTLELATSTCPQCARRPGEVEATVSTSGKIAKPGRLAERI